MNNPTCSLLGWFAVTPRVSAGVSLLVAYWMIACFSWRQGFSEYRLITHRADAGHRKSFRYYTEQNLLISMFFYTTCFALFLACSSFAITSVSILIVPLIAGFVSYYLHIAFKDVKRARSGLSGSTVRRA